MLFNSDWREEMRFLRLNNPSYRALFILGDLCKWCLYLAGAVLLFAFCWKMISPRNPVLSSMDTSRVLATGERKSEPAVHAAVANTRDEQGMQSHLQSEEISPARINYLRDLASRAKEQLLSRDDEIAVVDAAGVSLVSAQPEVKIQAMQNPEKIEPVSNPAQPQDSVTPLTLGSGNGSENNKPDTIADIAGNDSDDLSAGLGELIESIALSPLSPVVAPESVVKPVSNNNTEGPVEWSQSSKESSSISTGGNASVGYTFQNKPYQLSPWVLAQNASRFTIQIGATVNRPFLLRFVDRLPDEHVAALFRHRINRSNKEVYVLSYGSFSSYALANAALSKLSPSTKRYGAYIRSFKTLHAELDALQAETTQASPHRRDLANR